MNEFLKGLLEPMIELLVVVLQMFLGWGVAPWLAIVLLTVAVRAALLPLTVAQVRAARRLQELRPELEKIRRRHENDPKQQQEAMTRLYAERRTDPLGGCLPALLQMPVFLALYLALTFSGASLGFASGGLLWFGDLTTRDPFYVLPAVYALAMLAAQEPAMRQVSPEQRRLVRLLPLVFGLFLLRFPAGVLVYWISNSLITLLQNLLVYR